MVAPTQSTRCPKRGEASHPFCTELSAWPNTRDSAYRTSALWFCVEPVQAVCLFVCLFVCLLIPAASLLCPSRASASWEPGEACPQPSALGRAGRSRPCSGRAGRQGGGRTTGGTERVGRLPRNPPGLQNGLVPFN